MNLRKLTFVTGCITACSLAFLLQAHCALAQNGLEAEIVEGIQDAVERAGQEEDADASRPNFVIFFIDDMGYVDAGCYGAEVIHTPHIDQLAEEGMRFTSFYAQPICGPSRTALMTGCQPMRVAQHHNRRLVHPAVHSDEITLAEVLKEQGYATGCFGKWDMALHSQTDFHRHLMPNHQGFDYYFGTPSSNDRTVNLYRNEELIEELADMNTLTQRYTDEAIGFIERHHEQPLFVYIPQTMPHTVLGASEEFAGRSERGLYGDVIEEIDACVGRVMETLRRLELSENTYVLFTSDNGPWLIKNQDFQDGVLPSDHGGSAGPLRSGKVSTWEGGQRVPCIWWAPGRIPAGTTYEPMAATIDVMPTLATLAGTTPPTDRVIDGHDLTGILAGNFDQADEDRVFYFYLREHMQAVRQGPWKLHLRNRMEGENRTLGRRNRFIHPDDDVALTEHLLFNLDTDLGETTNVAAEHPEVVQHLLELASQGRDDIGDFDHVGENARFFDSLEEFPPSPRTTNR